MSDVLFPPCLFALSLVGACTVGFCWAAFCAKKRSTRTFLLVGGFFYCAFMFTCMSEIGYSQFNIGRSLSGQPRATPADFWPFFWTGRAGR